MLEVQEVRPCCEKCGKPADIEMVYGFRFLSDAGRAVVAQYGGPPDETSLLICISCAMDLGLRAYNYMAEPTRARAPD